MTEDDDGDDPIVSTHSIYVRAPLSANRQLLVLQHPNNAHYDDPSTLQSPAISEVRVKRASGMVEVDCPIDTGGAQYDRGKGMAWGAALHRSLAAKGGGSLGLAGGFGLGGGSAGRVRRGAASEEEHAARPKQWHEAVALDQVLRTQTLGGQSVRSRDARYMVGVFQGKAIHLTPVSSLVHLRPQLHYIDAAAEQERLGRLSESGAAGLGPGGKDGVGTTPGPPARAIHMTIKASTIDSDEVVTETMADRLRDVQLEPWRRLDYADEDTDDAWTAYQETLFLAPTAADKEDTDEPLGARARGKRPAAATDDEDRPDAGTHLGRTPRLQTVWSEDDLLRAVSGMQRADTRPGDGDADTGATAADGAGGSDRKAGPSKRKASSGKKAKGKAAAAAEAEDNEDAEQPKKRPGRPPKREDAAGAAAAGPAKKGGRAKASGGRGSTAGTAMDVD